MVRFTRSPTKVSLIRKAAMRAALGNTKLVIMDIEMDLSATNANGCRLDFERLLSFDDFDFAHDIYGIRNSLDRTTGKLVGHFLPRCRVRRAS